MENGKWRMKVRIDREAVVFILHFPFSILHFIL